MGGAKEEVGRILIACRHFRYGHGGVPQAVHLLAMAMAEIGIMSDVVTDGLFIGDVGQLADLPTVIGGRRWTNEGNQLCKYLALYVAGAWQFRAWPLIIVAWWNSVPIIYSPKGQLCTIEFRRLRDLKKILYLSLIEIWIAIIAKHVVFSSTLERTETCLPRAIKNAKGDVIPEPICIAAAERGQRERTLDRGEPIRIGYIAQISPRKGLAPLIKGFALFCEKNPSADACLYVAGTPIAASERYYTTSKEIARQSVAPNRVKFVGQVSGAARAEFYRQCHIVVVPSYFESFGLVVAEARAYGCDVIVGPNIGIVEYMFDDRNIFSIARIDPENIEDQLTLLVRKMSSEQRCEGQKCEGMKVSREAWGRISPMVVARAVYAMLARKHDGGIR